MFKRLIVSFLVLFILNNIIYYNRPEYRSTISIPSLPTASAKGMDSVETINRTQEFMDRLAEYESENNPNAVSDSKTYIGKYQLGPLALEEVGMKVSTREFIKNPEIFPEEKQDEAFLKYCLVNKEYLQREIDRYSGTNIKGIVITKAGILAAAHLVGFGPTRTYLRTHGRVDEADGKGRRCSFYIKKFQDFSDDHIVLNEELKKYK